MLAAVRKLVTVPARRILGTVTHVTTTQLVAAITFDDGPNPEFTLPLLEVLERRDVRATFFMVGDQARRHPDVVKRVAEAGHVIGNHSWDHPSFPEISGSARRRQLRQWERATAPYGSKLLRPPFGHQTLASRLEALLLGYRVVAWNVDTWDWCKDDARWMAGELERKTTPGSIILLHDAVYACGRDEDGYDRRPMIEAVEIFLDNVRERLRFVTVPDLLRSGSPVRVNWVRRARVKK